MKSQIISSLFLASLASASPLAAGNLKRAAGTPIGYGAGTTGGTGGTAVTVNSCADLEAAVTGTEKKVVTISGILSGCGIIDVDSNTSVLGAGANSGTTLSGFRVRQGTNVIFQNLKLGPAPPKGDIIALDESTNVWIDHNDFKSLGAVGGKDDLDGLLDVTHASDLITISWNTFKDHWKGSLVGHSDSNAAEDTGKLHLTYHHNLFSDVNSRLPSVRFGTVHIFNSVTLNSPTSGVNSRMGAQVLVENSIFDSVKLAMVTDLDSDLPGSICNVGNVLSGTSTIRITQECNLKPPYAYTLDATSGLQAAVEAGAGAGKL